MKPGMQRDIVVAFWLLFDEFEIGEDDSPATTSNQAPGSVPPRAASHLETVSSQKPQPPKRVG